MISIIAAVAQNNVIGKDNKLLWHLSEDLKRFKKITLNKKIIMGRKTFESLPGILPNREHIVITRDKDYTIDSDQVTVVHNLDSLLEKYSNYDDEIFVIGGAEIYTQLLPYTHKLYLTKIGTTFEGDTYFPDINYNDYKTEYLSEQFTDEKSGLTYTFIDLVKL